MLRIFASVVATVGLAVPALGNSADDAVTSFVLDNGMRVVVVEDHRAPV